MRPPGAGAIRAAWRGGQGRAALGDARRGRDLAELCAPSCALGRPRAEPLYIARRPLLLPRGAVRVRLGARGAVALQAGRRPPANQDWGRGGEAASDERRECHLEGPPPLECPPPLAAPGHGPVCPAPQPPPLPPPVSFASFPVPAYPVSVCLVPVCPFSDTV